MADTLTDAIVRGFEAVKQAYAAQQEQERAYSEVIAAANDAASAAEEADSTLAEREAAVYAAAEITKMFPGLVAKSVRDIKAEMAQAAVARSAAMN